MSRTISVYRPGRSFPSVSVTGKACSLLCDHCRGYYLSSMVDVSAEGALVEFASGLWDRGGKGLLLSGGCDASGRVPYPDHILSQVRGVKRTTGLVVNAHTGLVDGKEARRLALSGIDCFSFDVIGDDRSLREVFHLDATVEDVGSSLEALASTGVRVVPHVLAGLSGDVGEAERNSLRIVKRTSPEMVVLIVHIPTAGTPMGGRAPPDRQGIIDLASTMRKEIDGAELVLGCMRPKGDHPLEVGVLEAGFDGIVLPSSRTMAWIAGKGLGTAIVQGCCAPFPRNNRA